MTGTSPALIYRWVVFLLAAGYCLRTIFFGDFSEFGGPFRFLAIWALFMSFFAASRMMALMEGRSERRWDGFVCMTAVINAMVVLTYWRLFFADPVPVTDNGQLGAFHLEFYLHFVGPLLQWIDTVFVHRSYRRLTPAFLWFFGIISVYILWAELVVGPMNNTPAGTVTSGLPYPFLNDMELSGRLIFYASNFVVGVVFLLAFAGIARIVRRRFPAPAMP